MAVADVKEEGVEDGVFFDGDFLAGWWVQLKVEGGMGLSIW